MEINNGWFVSGRLSVALIFDEIMMPGILSSLLICVCLGLKVTIEDIMSKEWFSNFIYVFSLVFGDPLETVRFSAHKVAKWKDRLFGKGPKEKLKTEIFSMWC